jgi:hypothetical protein
MIDPTIIIHSDDVIQHFGTKGMKWGVRKAQVIVGRQRGIPRQNIKTPTKLTSEVKSKVLLKKIWPNLIVLAKYITPQDRRMEVKN